MAGETKEEQGLTREEVLEQERLRKEALLQVMSNMIGVLELEWVVDREREAQEVPEAGRAEGGDEAEDQGQGQTSI